MVQPLSLEKTQLSLVKEDDLRKVLKNFGLKIDENKKTGEEIVFKSTEDFANEVSAKCSGCGTTITLDNFGHLASGSKLIYCKNALCFNHYLALKKIK